MPETAWNEEFVTPASPAQNEEDKRPHPPPASPEYAVPDQLEEEDAVNERNHPGWSNDHPMLFDPATKSISYGP